MPVLRKRATGPVTVRRTVLFKVIEGAHDGYAFVGDASLNTGAPFIIVGDIRTTDGMYNYRSFSLLTAQDGAVIPVGATVVGSVLKPTVYAARTASYAHLFSFENADDASVPTSVSSLDAKPRTDSVSWKSGVSWVRDQTFSITTLSSIIQTVVNRTGWNGKELQLFWRRTATSGGFQQNDNHQIWSYNGNPAKALTLEVTYETTM